MKKNINLLLNLFVFTLCFTLISCKAKTDNDEFSEENGQSILKPEPQIPDIEEPVSEYEYYDNSD